MHNQEIEAAATSIHRGRFPYRSLLNNYVVEGRQARSKHGIEDRAATGVFNNSIFSLKYIGIVLSCLIAVKRNTR